MTDFARAALHAVVEHWPGNLEGLALTGTLSRSAAAMVLVQDLDGRALQIGFTRENLLRDPPRVLSSHVQLAYRAWQQPPPEPRYPPYAEP